MHNCMFLILLLIFNLRMFCREEPETLMHLFCGCKIVDIFGMTYLISCLSHKLFVTFSSAAVLCQKGRSKVGVTKRKPAGGRLSVRTK